MTPLTFRSRKIYAQTLLASPLVYLAGAYNIFSTLALTTSLHFVWRYLEPQIEGLPVEVSQIRGTIWQGRAQLKIQQLPVLGPIDSQWQLQFLPLLTGQAKV